MAMNATGRKMVELLKELRDDYGCTAIKSEFEAEGSRTDEMIMLCEVMNTMPSAGARNRPRTTRAC